MAESQRQVRRSKRATGRSSAVRKAEWSDDEPDEAQPAAKRPRTSGAAKDNSNAKKPKQVTRRRAKLGLLPTMPLDVLLEIFSHLKPLDLLRLSRTSKEFRKLLLDRSTRFVWINVLARIPGLPLCPEDISEPAYAHLAFEPTCHVCGAPRARDVHWMVRMRICNSCASREPGEVFTLVDTSLSQRGIHDLLPCIAGLHKSIQFRVLCRRDALSALEAKLHKLKKDGNAIQKYKEEKIAELKKIKDHALECARWFARMKDNHSDELEELRNERRRAIEQRLREAGFEKEVDWIDSPFGNAHRHAFKFHKDVRQPKMLTERIWRNMEQRMTNFMLSIRTKRKDQVWQKTLTNRGKILAGLLKHASHKAHDGPCPPVPNAADLYHWSDAIKTVLTTPLTEEEEDTVTEESFEQALTDLPRIIEEWDREKRAVLLSLLPVRSTPKQSKATNSSKDPAVLDRLDLATSLFNCTRCERESYTAKPRVYHSSNILAHQCSFRRRWYWDYRSDRPSTDSDRIDELHERLQAFPWIGDDPKVHYSQQAADRAKELVVLSGLDPNTATLEDMDKLDRRFVCSCLNCATDMYLSGKVWMTAMTWRQAATMTGCAHPSFELVGEEEEEEIKRAEAEAKFERWAFGAEREFVSSWTCTRCWESHLSAMRARAHVKERHAVEAVQKDDLVPDADRFVPPVAPVRLSDGKAEVGSMGLFPYGPMGYDDYYDLYSDSDGYDDDLDGLSFFGIGYDYHDSMDDSETDDDEDDEDDY